MALTGANNSSWALSTSGYLYKWGKQIKSIDDIVLPGLVKGVRERNVACSSDMY